jgi:hypothetical protein
MKTTYTMFEERDGVVEIVARSVDLAQALGLAVEHGGAGSAMVAHWDAELSRCFELFRV